MTNVKPPGLVLPDPAAICVPRTVLADPEGNVFCLLEPKEIYADTGPIAAMDVSCADPRAMTPFWNAAMDWIVHEVTDDLARLCSAAGSVPSLEFVRVPDITVWTRVHLDLRPYFRDDQAAEVARPRTLGAMDADIGPSDVPRVVLTDPEGNPFCVLTPC
ncbi:VOC family protein [Cryobacterium ruanii]|uniref:VOC family protein n=1 Tax=Cryobacterium ruanii TaxID=1259197 RepID=UPI001F53EF5D|nr:VOC family protein [Cryobacterium ruanii]